MAIKIPSSKQYEIPTNKVVLNNKANSVTYTQDLISSAFLEIFSTDSIFGKASPKKTRTVWAEYQGVLPSDQREYLRIEYVLATKIVTIENIDTSQIDFEALIKSDSNISLIGMWGTKEINVVGKLGVCDIENNIDFNFSGAIPSFLSDYKQNGFANVWYNWEKLSENRITLTWNLITSLTYTHWYSFYGGSRTEVLFDGDYSASNNSTGTLSFSVASFEKEEQEVKINEYENVSTKKYKIQSNELFQGLGFYLGEPTITFDIYYIPDGAISSGYAIDFSAGLLNDGLITNYVSGNIKQEVSAIIALGRCYVIQDDTLLEYGALSATNQGELIANTLSTRKLYANKTIGDMLADKILDRYLDGRQYVSLNCFYDEYENSNGEVVISKNEGTLIEPETIIAPYVMKNGVEVPLVYSYQNGIKVPKLYEVEIRELNYDGTLIQTLKCLESDERKYEVTFNAGFGTFPDGKFIVTFASGNGSFKEKIGKYTVVFNSGNGIFTTN